MPPLKEHTDDVTSRTRVLSWRTLRPTELAAILAADIALYATGELKLEDLMDWVSE